MTPRVPSRRGSAPLAAQVEVIKYVEKERVFSPLRLESVAQPAIELHPPQPQMQPVIIQQSSDEDKHMIEKLKV